MNHLDPCSFIKSVKNLPNLYERYETIKKRKPLEIMLIKIKTGRLKPIKPLTIVKTLYGKGVNPAKKSMPSQVLKPLPSCIFETKCYRQLDRTDRGIVL